MARNLYLVLHTKGRRKGTFPEVLPTDKPGYSLQSAKDYARISSQHGDPTEVYRKVPGKKIKGMSRVRRYEKGQRTFPMLPAELKGLTKSEVPKEMMRFWKEMSASAKKNPRKKPGLPDATVATWHMVLVSKLTQYGAQLHKRGQYNMYRLGHWFKAAQKLENDPAVKKVWKKDTPEALRVYQDKMLHYFEDFSPVKAVKRQIEAYLKKGTMPSLVRKNPARKRAKSRPNPRIGGTIIKVTATLTKQGDLTLVPYSGQQEQFYKAALARVLNVALPTLMRKPLLTIPKDNVKDALSALTKVGMSDRKAREFELTKQATFKMQAKEYESWIDKAYKVNIFPDGKSVAKKNPARKGPVWPAEVEISREKGVGHVILDEQHRQLSTPFRTAKEAKTHLRQRGYSQTPTEKKINLWTLKSELPKPSRKGPGKGWPAQIRLEVTPGRRDRWRIKSLRGKEVPTGYEYGMSLQTAEKMLRSHGYSQTWGERRQSIWSVKGRRARRN